MPASFLMASYGLEGGQADAAVLQDTGADAGFDRTIGDRLQVVIDGDIHMADYKFSSLSVSTMLSLRIIAPETIMVAKTIARMPSTQAAIAPQGSLKAK